MNVKDCLLTCLNKDTSELYHELIPYGQKTAQCYVERAHELLQLVEQPEAATQLGRTPEYFECRMCRFHDHCCVQSKKKFPCFEDQGS